MHTSPSLSEELVHKKVGNVLQHLATKMKPEYISRRIPFRCQVHEHATSKNIPQLTQTYSQAKEMDLPNWGRPGQRILECVNSISNKSDLTMSNSVGSSRLPWNERTIKHHEIRRSACLVLYVLQASLIESSNLASGT